MLECGIIYKEIASTVLFAALLVSCADEPFAIDPPVGRFSPDDPFRVK